MLRDAGFIGCADEPTDVTATWDDQGRPRRVRARYPGGWSCVMNIRADGSYTLSQCLRLRFSSRRPA